MSLSVFVKSLSNLSADSNSNNNTLIGTEGQWMVCVQLKDKVLNSTAKNIKKASSSLLDYKGSKIIYNEVLEFDTADEVNHLENADSFIIIVKYTSSDELNSTFSEVGRLAIPLSTVLDTGYLDIKEEIDSPNTPTKIYLELSATYRMYKGDPLPTPSDLVSHTSKLHQLLDSILVEEETTETSPLIRTPSSHSIAKSTSINTIISQAPASTAQTLTEADEKPNVKSKRKILRLLRTNKDCKEKVKPSPSSASSRRISKWVATGVVKKFKRKPKEKREATPTSLSGYEPDDAVDGADDDIYSLSSIGSSASMTHPYSQLHKEKFSSRILHHSRDDLPQDFQVGITIVEIRQLQGLNLNPLVTIQLGDSSKKTSTKESTNCPFYDEYFVFDFTISRQSLLEKIMTFSVYNSTLLSKGKLLGQFKIELDAVYKFPGHQVYHKWAELTESDDILSENKGYLLCDISITGKDCAKIVPEHKENFNDIERNILLPHGCNQFERQRMKLSIKIYRAEHLPFMNIGLLANMKKALTGEITDLVDPYVQVTYAGTKCRTSVKKGQCAPVWNEALSFVTMIPSLCNIIQIQLKDKSSIHDDIIGTHYIDISDISNTGTSGFLPTYGPSWVNLYGSYREVTVLDEHKSLNSGMGEGIAYRGRLLIAIHSEICDNTTAAQLVNDKIEVSRISPINESALPGKQEFVLYASIFEVTMLSSKARNQPTQVQMCFGFCENLPTQRGDRTTMQHAADPFSVPLLLDSENTPLVNTSLPSLMLPCLPSSITQPRVPSTSDRQTFTLYEDHEKPCLIVNSYLEDTSDRLFIQNIFDNLTQYLSKGLSVIRVSVIEEEEEPNICLKRFIQLILGFVGLCNDLLKSWPKGSIAATKLDRERKRVCRQKLESASSKARALRNKLTIANIREKMRQLHDILIDIQSVAYEPQDSLPDIFIWLTVAGKRLAYVRIPAKDIIYSSHEKLRGKHCQQVTTVALKLPGKKSIGTGGWRIQGQITLMLWLGTHAEKSIVFERLPPGFKSLKENSRGSSLSLSSSNSYIDLPLSLHYMNNSTYQLRAYVYQARAIIGSDSSGLSDPYAVVQFAGHSVSTRVIDETLSPTWNQMLIIDDIRLPFPASYMKSYPPVITIELYDYDTIGKPEYLGRSYAYPLIKCADEAYESPVFPALLQWWHLYRGHSPAGELLASFELYEKPFDISEVYKLLLSPRVKAKARRDAIAGIPVEGLNEAIRSAVAKEQELIIPIPGSIRPIYSKHRIEVLFWGVRDMKKLQFTSVTRPRIDVECAGHVISSLPLIDANKNPNFAVPVLHTDVDLPEDQIYCPPITIRCVDCRSFGRFVLVGTHTINSIQKYLYKIRGSQNKTPSLDPARSIDTETTTIAALNEQIPNDRIETVSMTTNQHKQTDIIAKAKGEHSYMTSTLIKQKTVESTQGEVNGVAEVNDIDFSTLDWWSKYYASTARYESMQQVTDVETHETVTHDIDDDGLHATVTMVKTAENSTSLPPAKRFASQAKSKYDLIQTFNIYDKELELFPEFNGFAEWLHTFSLYRGKKSNDDEDEDSRVVGKFKGCIQIYKHGLFAGDFSTNIVGGDLKKGMFHGLPSNGLMKVLVRIYVVLAKELHPADLNGKADPYLVIKLGNKTISDVENYIPKQLNPIFGRCFEQEVTFPMESQLTVQVWDWDLLSKDDLIGETKIDLENRFYSKHRATCGLPEYYQNHGYNEWRDREKPTQILSKLCKERQMEPPHYRLHQGKVTVGGRDFVIPEVDVMHMEENLALKVLKHWHEFKPQGCALVPEHVETRSLYNAEKPGVEQGKIQLWIDMFSMDTPVIPKAVDISPRKPVGYELRVIIWNTDEVILEEDDFFTGEKSSDIYVKGWVTDSDNSQSTDVHYRSLTGEGNFNWRFVLPFDYLVAEQKIVVKKKETPFSWDESETKIPARLTLQVWDADHISADDFLGSLTADLTKFPRGAKSVESCMLVADSTVPTVNLFKQKRMKGWWPFLTDNGRAVAGKVEAEIELLTAEEAEKKPVGKGRSPPEELEKPNRPDTAFLWFLNPLKSMKYLFCKRYKWLFIKLLIVVVLGLLVVLLVYNIPGYTAKKLVGA